MSVWRLIVAGVLTLLAAGLVWLSSIPDRAFKAEEKRLAAAGYAFLPLSRVNDPLKPQSLYLTCRHGVLGLSGVVVMPAHDIMREDVGFPEEDVFGPAKATIFLNREPNRHGSPKLETRATFIVRRHLDRLTVDQLDKTVIVPALLQLHANRLSLISLDQGLEFALKVDHGRAQTFLARCA